MSDYIYIDEKARRKALSTKTREYLIKRILDLEEENKDIEYEAMNRD
jgi:uncharacterized protein Smg (DUF494 family)